MPYKKQISMEGALDRPAWLDKKISLKDCRKMEDMLTGLKLNTVCQQAACPNISECFSRGEATFLILGDICTRNCRFCAVKKGIPGGLDETEPERVSEAVKRLGLRHVVITSVTRDDLADGGALHFSKTVRTIRWQIPGVSIELLIPDLKGNRASLKVISEVGPDIVGHNIETVPRLYKHIRPMADYRLSLRVIRTLKEIDEAIYTKSAIMLGLGETDQEVFEVISDLRSNGCDIVFLGQYLSPDSSMLAVQEYIHPEKFEYYRSEALRMGFRYVASSPYVRSSYLAEEALA